MERETVYRACQLCEATCGVAIEVEDNRVVTVRGDEADPFSKGFICPKAYGLKELHDDPDRLRAPVRRTATGWEEISWDEAYRETIDRLQAVREAHGPNAVGVYRGNPTVHDLQSLLFFPALERALSTQNYFSAASLDTQAKYVQAGLMFGGMLHIPIPDLERTQYLLMLGANPAASNGSLMTAPDAPGRLERIRARGGKVVLIDPSRTETAKLVDEHHFIRPSMDVCFLLAMVHTMFAEDLVEPGACTDVLEEMDALRALLPEFTPEAMAPHCGIAADTIRRLTREFCAADGAACYGRMGTCTQPFGTLASWGCDLVNVLSGNLDRPGGVLFTSPAAPVGFMVSPTKGVTFGQWSSRVGGHDEIFGQFPASAMAEEIETPGEGQIRAMVTVAGNPVCSSANAERLSRALDSLEFMVSVDVYINETTRHADIILPPNDRLENGHYDLGLYNMAVRNVAKWSRPALPVTDGTQQPYEILRTLAQGLMGMGGVDPDSFDNFLLQQYAELAVGDHSPWDGLTADEAVGKLEEGPAPERLLDLLLRNGQYGDGFGRKDGGLTLARLKEAEHGIDLGPLEPQLPGKLNTPDGRIHLAPERITADLDRLRTVLADRDTDRLLLINRRHLRSNNSWMHNLPALMKGRDRCTLRVSEQDAQRLNLEPDGRARITSRVGTVVAPVEITDTIMPGVVSLPHGYGHDVEGVQMDVARAHAGVNVNALTDDEALDEPSGTVVLFGVPVTVEAAP